MRIAKSCRRAVTPLLVERAAGRPAGLLEALEPRMVLSTSPLPTIADLESANDTVVRIETNYGDVDIELYNSAAPITVSNFLNYVNSGRFGDTFFHRSSFSNGTPFVLQGGGFSYADSAGLNTVATDAPIIRETTGKSNLAQTISMARTSAITSATSQFFINYVDNTFLDPTSATTGYAVFGKVIQGWDVVTTIEGLQSLDLTADPAFAGTNSGAFGEVPVGSTYSSTVGVRQADLVTLIAAEVIKPATISGFFSQKVYYPEGFRSDSSSESLELFNPNSVGGAYQVIVRYETGQRDTMIASGTLAGNTKLEIQLSDSSQPGLNVVRSGVPYAIEVDSAFAETLVAVQPMAASSNRFDFNADTGESFFNPASVSDPAALKTWDLPRIERNSLSREFIVYQNLSDTAATVTTVFHTAGGDLIAVRTLEPYRRGGLEVFGLGIPDGVLWATVTSTQDIVVAMSDWDLPAAGASAQTAYTPAFGSLGVTGGGSTTGGYAGAQIQTNYTSTLSFVNPGSSAAAVTITLWHTSGASSTTGLSVPADGRDDLTLDPAALGVAAGEFFTLTYTSSAPVAVQYTSADDVGRNQSTGKHSDGIATVFSTGVAPISYFADGALDPTLASGAQTETISIFNPFATSTESFSYTVRYCFTDGTSIDGATGTLSRNGRVDIVSGSIATVRAKAASSPSLRNYSIAVIGTATNTGTNAVTQVSPLVVLTRWDTSAGRAIATGPMASGVVTALNDPLFG